MLESGNTFKNEISLQNNLHQTAYETSWENRASGIPSLTERPCGPLMGSQIKVYYILILN